MDKDRVKNIVELSKKLNLSITTISRVINGKAEKYRISQKTQEKVMKAVNAYRYAPNKFARGLKLEKSETIGLIIPDISNPFFAGIAKIIEGEAREHGFSTILCDSNESTKTEKSLLRVMASQQVDGIIIAPVGSEYAHIKSFSAGETPVTIIDRYFLDIEMDYVTSDNFQAAYDATAHFIQKGHTRIACIQGLASSQPNADRVEGYKRALMDHQIDLDPQLVKGNHFGMDNGYKYGYELLSMPEKPTAILALSNLISLGLLQALREKRLNVPEDISIISFDEQPYSAFLSTPMTTIEQDKKAIGQLAVKNLLQKINGEDVDYIADNKVKAHLILRDSVKNMS